MKFSQPSDSAGTDLTNAVKNMKQAAFPFFCTDWFPMRVYVWLENTTTKTIYLILPRIGNSLIFLKHFAQSAL